MKLVALLFLLHSSSYCNAQDKEPEFAIYFGNDFRDDSVTIFVNAILIAKNIKLSPTVISPENLIIIQDDHNIMVQPHHKPRQMLKKIPVKDSILNLDIVMNNVRKNFTLNLRQGRFLYPEYKSVKVGWFTFRKLEITQDKRGPVML